MLYYRARLMARRIAQLIDTTLPATSVKREIGSMTRDLWASAEDKVTAVQMIFYCVSPRCRKGVAIVAIASEWNGNNTRDRHLHNAGTANTIGTFGVLALTCLVSQLNGAILAIRLKKINCFSFFTFSQSICFWKCQCKRMCS